MRTEIQLADNFYKIHGQISFEFITYTLFYLLSSLTNFKIVLFWKCMIKMVYDFYIEARTYKEAKTQQKDKQSQVRLLENLSSLFPTLGKAPPLSKHC